ncbi:CMRF35-like molecule 8 isoform X1 [Paramisgurnus dabryanus]|uniref:CMRF35-like molecule 8 isoform X1 n=1 Tax=Paramisgurnus dabryanus TaxID=90735 RepID=UPI0031F3E16B
MMFCFSRSIRMIKAHLKILILYRVLSGVLVKSGNVFEGTVGQTAVIRCPFPDLHIYTPKYFCRDPCSSSRDVLIKTEKIDEVVSAGRYSVRSTANTMIFTVTIRHLTLKDSGVYYCALDQWFRDTLEKVQLVVRPAPVIPPLNTLAPTYNTTHTSADHSSLSEQLLTTPQWSTVLVESYAVDGSMVWVGLLMLVMFLVLVAPVYFNRRSCSKSKFQDASNHNQTVKDDVLFYDKTMVWYSLVDPPKDDFSLLCSNVQYCDHLE